jgi:hypothetical protein
MTVFAFSWAIFFGRLWSRYGMSEAKRKREVLKVERLPLMGWQKMLHRWFLDVEPRDDKPDV